MWSGSRPGFALVVTISLMVLLTILGVGLLTLSVITLRSSAGSAAQAEAQANARLALLLAIGELQKQAGADQRITANAGILDESPGTAGIEGVKHPHWTGVWDSWAAGGRQFGKDDKSEHRTIQGDRNRGMAPSYESGRKDHFRSWLVSLARGAAGEFGTAKTLALDGSRVPGKDSVAAQLVGPGSIGADATDADRVVAGLLGVENPGSPGKGRFAWWVADESTKARIMLDPFEAGGELADAGLIDRIQNPGATGHGILPELAQLDDPELMKRMFTRQSFGIPAEDPAVVRGVFHAVTPYSFGVMADVREGGLKRDLSVLLERPIDVKESADKFMLYRLGRNKGDRVPIQDLAAYYQSYRDVINYTGSTSNNRYSPGTMQVNNIDFQEGFNFRRDFTNLYRMPFPVKVQFLLSYTGVKRTPTTENPDPYMLHIGMTPALTMWNPYNVPLVLNVGGDQATQLRFFNLPFGLKWSKSGARGAFASPTPNSLVWITNRNQEEGDRDNGLTLYVGGIRNHVIFQPGEVRVFSLRRTQTGSGVTGILNKNQYTENREADPGWDPTFFLSLPRSEKANDNKHVHIEFPNATDRWKKDGGSLTFNTGDDISLTVSAAEAADMANGAAFHFFHRQSSTMAGEIDNGDDKAHMRRQFQLTSRLHTDAQFKQDNGFNEQLMKRAFPGNAGQIVVPAIKGRELVGQHRPFLLVSLTAGCEVSQENSGEFRGRRFVSRPFLHSTPVQTMVWVDEVGDDAFYQHGWNWWVQDINSVLEATVQVAGNNRSGYWGGGYTPEFGSTNIVQQEVPVAPVHSIGALSHAQLSGYSLTDEILGSGASGRVNNFEGATATGGNGLFPRTSQAIGNSYAHPYLRQNEAFGTWTRHYNATEGPETIPFADHSYLANKALWDDYFFSSIAPRRTKIFSSAEQGSARQVAERFFKEGGKLPNRRFVPYRPGNSAGELGRFFSGDRANLVAADEFAALLLLEGPFNVNSTSVDAWRALFASQREREVPYLSTNDNQNKLERGVPIKRVTGEGTVVAGTTLGAGEPVAESASEPAEPRQWHCWRQLSDDEIGQLAAAMVGQVKRRGPFLSLSEFVNRRLDRSNAGMAVKGALQAAIDDEEVDINKGFRDELRRFSEKEIRGMRPKFREALAGPVAYGSAAYVDQADILRSLGAQLTPRGDTFLIRTYGDSVGAGGRVQARAWCEAVVQRVPEYLQAGADAPQAAFDALKSEANKEFGRSFRLVLFRWLDADEI